MITIALGDIHGRKDWKDIINKEYFNRLIIHGDYFDTRENINTRDQIDNFFDLLEYQRTGAKEVILLLGNHDYHYLELDGPYSGYQYENAKAITHALQGNLDYLQVAYKDGDVLFSHAGVTATWLKSLGYDGTTHVDTFINFHLKYKPWAFVFDGREPSGDNITQSPIWVRPKSLMQDGYHWGQLTQVVGHTTMKDLKSFKNRFWFIDTLGTSGEYLRISEHTTGTKIFTVECLQNKRRKSRKTSCLACAVEDYPIKTGKVIPHTCKKSTNEL